MGRDGQRDLEVAARARARGQRQHGRELDLRQGRTWSAAWVVGPSWRAGRREGRKGWARRVQGQTSSEPKVRPLNPPNRTPRHSPTSTFRSPEQPGSLPRVLHFQLCADPNAGTWPDLSRSSPEACRTASPSCRRPTATRKIPSVSPALEAREHLRAAPPDLRSMLDLEEEGEWKGGSLDYPKSRVRYVSADVIPHCLPFHPAPGRSSTDITISEHASCLAVSLERVQVLRQAHRARHPRQPHPPRHRPLDLLHPLRTRGSLKGTGGRLLGGLL